MQAATAEKAVIRPRPVAASNRYHKGEAGDIKGKEPQTASTTRWLTLFPPMPHRQLRIGVHQASQLPQALLDQEYVKAKLGIAPVKKAIPASHCHEMQAEVHPRQDQKTTAIISMVVQSRLLMLRSWVEKPLMATVAKAWQTASNRVMPAPQWARAQATVSQR